MTAPALVLHHYAGSPFAEKARLMLGFKGLAWQSVTVPVTLPKPDVQALTGGYRRTPFLQLGADIVCDTALIADTLEQLRPEPSLFPAAQAGAARLLAQWADSELFWTVMPYAMQPAGVAAIFEGAPPAMLQAFAADRRQMTEGMPRRTPQDAAAALQQHLASLENLLTDGRPWLLGEAASVADFSAYHPLWFLARSGPLAEILAPHTRLRDWMARVAVIGHGERAGKLDGEAAIALARASTPAPVTVQPSLGFEAGEPCSVTPLDYAREPVHGRLVGLDLRRVSLAREDARAGLVHVHFPRIGYQLRRDEPRSQGPSA